jgi:DNA-binding GntR family transcriptional regulator
MTDKPLDLAFAPRQRRVLTDDVADAIREAILSGRIAPGARLIEDDLASSLDVSRGPIRQAIFRLQQEGLVVHEAHRGATVAHVSEDDIAEIYSLRTALERLAVAEACKRADAEDLAPLEAILVLFRSTPRSEISRKKVAELDIDFHDALFRAARHKRLYRAWQGLRSQIMVFLLLRDALPDDYLDSWHRDHRKLLDLVRAGDVGAAVEAIETHIGGALGRLLAMLAKQAGSAGQD